MTQDPTAARIARQTSHPYDAVYRALTAARAAGVRDALSVPVLTDGGPRMLDATVTALLAYRAAE